MTRPSTPATRLPGYSRRIAFRSHALDLASYAQRKDDAEANQRELDVEERIGQRLGRARDEQHTGHRVDPEARPHHEEIPSQRVERDAQAESEHTHVPRDIRADEEREADGVQDQNEGKDPQRWDFEATR